jgi:putative hydrolase
MARNRLVADVLHQLADLLEQQHADPFRVRAYRHAADVVASLDVELDDLVAREGRAGLVALPAIGERIAGTILEILSTGRSSQLDRLRGTFDPEELFQAVPGIGPELARRVHDALQIDTLEALELAAHDGRLAGVSGIGPRRLAMIRTALASLLGRRRPSPPAAPPEPAVHVLLDVDAEYRTRSAAGELGRIAPRRFNPSGTAWLPILHTGRGEWRFTALYSNTARAHELGRTRDWVVVYFQGDHRPEGQRTLVTETRGALEGLRVVRGREPECHAWYGERRTRAELGV